MNVACCNILLCISLKHYYFHFIFLFSFFILSFLICFFFNSLLLLLYLSFLYIIYIITFLYIFLHFFNLFFSQVSIWRVGKWRYQLFRMHGDPRSRIQTSRWRTNTYVYLRTYVIHFYIKLHTCKKYYFRKRYQWMRKFLMIICFT